MPGSGLAQKIERSIAGVMSWVEGHCYRAYDPGDGNLSFLHPLTFNNLMLERVLQQAVYRSPINLRPLLGISPHVSTKGKGYMAWGYIKMYRLTGNSGYADAARANLQWLVDHSSPFYPDHSWGNDFPFCTRGGKTPALEPIVPWTALIGQAFFEAYGAFGDERYRRVLESIGRWIMKLPRERTDTGTCISYVAFKQNSIHNSNMLAASFLAQLARLTGGSEPMDAAVEAMRYSCARQRDDGAWMYGAAANYQWNDNFHTGYNLDCLRRYQDASGDRQFDGHLRRGFDYFQRHFFEPDGRPRYYDTKTMPTDIQCAAQAIDTLTLFADEESGSLSLAEKVADWTIDNMQDRDGHFYYRDLGWIKARTPMLHWGQGTMFKALAHLLSKSAPAAAS